MQEYPLLIVLGPTASGKTKLAVQLALALNGEIISADSRQVFRGMNIGTGKDLHEYSTPVGTVRYHLIDIHDAGTKYNVDLFKEEFYEAFNNISSREKLPILCGGTGMYIHSLLQKNDFTSIPIDLDLREALADEGLGNLQKKLSTYPEVFSNHADQSTRKRLIRAIEVAQYLSTTSFVQKERIKINPVVIGLQDDLSLRRQKILTRLDERLDQGLIAEVESLISRGVSEEMLTFYGLEYKIVVSYLKQELTYKQLKEQLYTGICQYAKRQMTFFRKMEKDGIKIRWYQAATPSGESRDQILNDLKGVL